MNIWSNFNSLHEEHDLEISWVLGFIVLQCLAAGSSYSSHCNYGIGLLFLVGYKEAGYPSCCEIFDWEYSWSDWFTGDFAPSFACTCICATMPGLFSSCSENCMIEGFLKCKLDDPYVSCSSKLHVSICRLLWGYQLYCRTFQFLLAQLIRLVLWLFWALWFYLLILFANHLFLS